MGLINKVRSWLSLLAIRRRLEEELGLGNEPSVVLEVFIKVIIPNDCSWDIDGMSYWANFLKSIETTSINHKIDLPAEKNFVVKNFVCFSLKAMIEG